MAMIRMENVGGAVVKRGFSLGDTYLKPGTNISAQKLAEIPKVNRNSLVNIGRLELYPMPPDSKRHIVSAGFGNFNVIEGVLLNAEPLTRDEAIALAGVDPTPVQEPEDAPKEVKEPETATAPTPKQTRAKARTKRKVKATAPRN